MLISCSCIQKHIPIVEYHENIIEGINNNIFGTQVICESAIESELKKLLSYRLIKQLGQQM